MGPCAPPGSAQESLSESASRVAERVRIQVTLVSRNQPVERIEEPPLEWTNRRGQSVRGSLSPRLEVQLCDMELRPSSSGSGAFTVYLSFQDLGHSSQDYSQSRTALALAVKVEPKELPLFSGLIGRIFTATWRLPQTTVDSEVLKTELATLQGKYQNLRWVLNELAQSD